jgi:hypothetical protein
VTAQIRLRILAVFIVEFNRDFKLHAVRRGNELTTAPLPDILARVTRAYVDSVYKTKEAYELPGHCANVRYSQYQSPDS